MTRGYVVVTVRRLPHIFICCVVLRETASSGEGVMPGKHGETGQAPIGGCNGRIFAGRDVNRGGAQREFGVCMRWC